jgi:hypothetical protein
METVPMQPSAEVDATPKADDDRLWSVTTILKSFGDSQGLIEWSAGAVADTAIEQHDWLGQKIKAEGVDEARTWLIGSRYRPKAGQRSATGMGKAVHAAIEHLVVYGSRPPYGTPLADAGEMDAEVDPYLDQFDAFLDYFQPEFEAAEMTVYHPDYGYAGTLDGIAVIQGERVVIDYKTKKEGFNAKGKRTQPYSDVALQLAAYRHATAAAVLPARKHEQGWGQRYYLLNADERAATVPMPKTDGGLVVHITPEHCDTYPVDTSDAVHEFFLFAMEAARWSLQVGRKAIGQPLALLDARNRKA